MIEPVRRAPTGFSATSPGRPSPGRRCKTGGRAATASSVMVAPTDGMVHVVVPVRGSVTVWTVDGRHEVEQGRALLLARPDEVRCVWHTDSDGLILSLPRPAIQAVASTLFDEPRRLASIACSFAWSDRPAWMSGPVAGEAGDPARERLLCISLVRALEREGLAKAAFPVAGSVLRAIRHIRANPQKAWTVADLAPLAGVTVATLRKNFRACLGTSVTHVVRDVRLDWVRERLRSGNETRSVGQLGEAAGFGGAALLARAYQQRFAETPTQTRANAFKGGREQYSR
ncbi:AraC family transcriptional regulator [Sphingomonas sp. HF-S3]|uniref:AraC family transcriptional regulator n=2 Tax=Sphingomonas rustica TaxID=3103142 RepID=A0ABV0B5L6_9SPHN